LYELVRKKNQAVVPLPSLRENSREAFYFPYRSLETYFYLATTMTPIARADPKIRTQHNREVAGEKERRRSGGRGGVHQMAEIAVFCVLRSLSHYFIS
jgi:hypothetical protein